MFLVALVIKVSSILILFEGPLRRVLLHLNIGKLAQAVRHKQRWL